MVKKVKVQLFGTQNRHVIVDSEATEGAVLGRDLKWPDGSIVTPQQIINQTTVIDTGSGEVSVAVTLWSLILNIPAFIKALVALVGTGFVVRSTVGGAAELRSITGTIGRIDVANGDGVADNPVIQLGNFPTVKRSIEVGEDYTIPGGHQLLVFDEFVFDGGNLTLDGELVVL